MTLLPPRFLEERLLGPVIGLETILVLSDSLESFVAKLQVHLSQIWTRTRPTEYVEPSITIREIVAGETDLKDVRVVKVMGVYTDYEATRFLDFPLLQFHIKSFSESGLLQLTAKVLNFVELLDYFEELLTVIVQRHSVSPDTIYAEVKGKSEVSDRSLWVQAADNTEKKLIHLAKGETLTNAADEPETPNESLVPKRADAYSRWKKAYESILELRVTYRENYDDWNNDDPSPTLDDIRDHLASEVGWKPSGRTIQKIIKAGDNGELT